MKFKRVLLIDKQFSSKQCFRGPVSFLLGVLPSSTCGFQGCAQLHEARGKELSIEKAHPFHNQPQSEHDIYVLFTFC